MSDILQEIAAYKREFVAQAKRRFGLDDMRIAANDSAEPGDFASALQGEGIALIAEIKKASPSKGVIRADFDHERIAATYAENGASALSVLTDEAYFQGRDIYLPEARQVAELPALRKDFTVDAYQVYQARYLGADALLLIVALMDSGQLEDLYGLGRELGLACLVEVHTREEMVRATQIGAHIVGINNRNLKTFTTTLDTTFELMGDVPDGIIQVSESGINHRDDVERLEAAGVDAVLVGEALMREQDIGAKVRELLGH